ncbi:MAG: hypothetical protein KBD48_00040 [Candidatus Pacebacteria bacterium]|nr:hypothetical protein [Candidatus Paceibacterota bacterium]MBP9715569.1 hypothetical protein [Candidatus Paceibacterota bacterium]
MVKKVVQDINIKKPKLLKFDEPNDSVISGDLDTEQKFSAISQMQRRRRIPSTPMVKRKKLLPRYFVWILVALVIVSLVYVSYAFLQKATVSINTRKQNFTFKEEVFTAYKQNEKKPHFEIMILNDVYSRKINFIDPKDVSIKAHGVVFIKNEYSSKPQKILINTKIADDYGRLYTTDSTVTVPGFTKVKDKVIPGSTAVKVTAVSAGEEHNTSSKNFLIPSFEKTDKYTKIYATALNPIIGGALGKLYSLGPVEIGTLNAEANTFFREQAMRKLSAQIPPGYILYPGATNFSYSFNQDSKSKDAIGEVEISGVVNAIIFKIEDLEKVFIKRAGPNIKDSEYSEISVENMDSFILKLSDKNKIISKDMNEVSFSLTGGSVLIWSPDIDQIRQSILGLDVKDLGQKTQEDPGVVGSSVEFLLPFQDKIPNKTHMVDVKTY